MLRADIRQFSVVRRLVNEDIILCAVPLMLRADIYVTGCGIDELHPATGIFNNIAYLFTPISQTRVLQTKYQNTHKYLNLNQTKTYLF